MIDFLDPIWVEILEIVYFLGWIAAHIAATF